MTMKTELQGAEAELSKKEIEVKSEEAQLKKLAETGHYAYTTRAGTVSYAPLTQAKYNIFYKQYLSKYEDYKETYAKYKQTYDTHRKAYDQQQQRREMFPAEHKPIQASATPIYRYAETSYIPPKERASIVAPEVKQQSLSQQLDELNAQISDLEREGLSSSPSEYLVGGGAPAEYIGFTPEEDIRYGELWRKKRELEAQRLIDTPDHRQTSKTIGERKAEEAFGVPTWKETTAAGWLYTTGRQLADVPALGPLRYALRGIGDIVVMGSGFIAPFEDSVRSWYSLVTGQPQPNIPEPSGAIITSLQPSISAVPPFIHVKPHVSKEAQELAGLEHEYQSGALAGEIAMSWLTGKAISWGIGKISPRLPSALKKRFVKPQKTVTRKLETYPAQAPLRTETIPYGLEPLKGVPPTYPLSWKHPPLSPEDIQIWYRYVGKGAEARGLTGDFIKFTRGFQSTPMKKTLEKTVSSGSQLLVTQMPKTASKVVTRVSPKLLAESMKIVSKPTTAAKAMSYVSSYVVSQAPKMWQKPAPPPSKTEVQQTPWTMLKPYSPQTVQPKQTQKTQQRTKQIQREIVDTRQIGQFIFQPLTQTDLTSKQKERFIDIVSIMPRLRFDTPTISQHPPPERTSFTPPIIDFPRPSLPPFKHQKKRRGKKHRVSPLESGWVVHTWPVRTFGGFKDLTEILGF